MSRSYTMLRLEDHEALLSFTSREKKMQLKQKRDAMELKSTEERFEWTSLSLKELTLLLLAFIWESQLRIELEETGMDDRKEKTDTTQDRREEDTGDPGRTTGLQDLLPMIIMAEEGMSMQDPLLDLIHTMLMVILLGLLLLLPLIMKTDTETQDTLLEEDLLLHILLTPDLLLLEGQDTERGPGLTLLVDTLTIDADEGEILAATTIFLISFFSSSNTIEVLSTYLIANKPSQQNTSFILSPQLLLCFHS